METETLTHAASGPRFIDAQSPPPPPSPPPGPPAPPGPGGPAGPAGPKGLRPTDPTRSGAMWVGAAGVALLLAAAAVLTAVRWDDIGQSVKLGGLVAITLALLAAGERFKKTIPMTAEAIFHLGALLIPFDMAAVAILAGRSWQETLLLTSVTSVVAWYGINRARPSTVLRWSARGAVVMLAAGIASVSPLAMPAALALAAAAALAASKPVAAGLWAGLAGLLPIAAFVPWPVRIADSMKDLGFDALDRWQPLAAGIIATGVMVGVSFLRPRIEVAWSAVTLALITLLVALGGFADANLSYLAIGGVFLALELAALAAVRDRLWKPILDVVALVAEMAALLTTTMVFAITALDFDGGSVSARSLGVTGVLLALGWLIADRRRLEEPLDNLVAMVVGSNWQLATVMFPMALLGGMFGFGVPAWTISLTAVALAYWMVATWRTGSEYGAMALGLIALIVTSDLGHWPTMAIGALVAAVLMMAAQFRLRADADFGAIMAAVASVLFWLWSSLEAMDAYDSRWPLLMFFIGAWALSWIAEARGAHRRLHPVDFAGRVAALGALVLGFGVSPYVLLAMCGALLLLAGADYERLRRHGASEGGLRSGYATLAGASIGLAGLPVGVIAGLSMPSTGVALAVLGFVAVGIALISPREFGLPLGGTAVTATSLGLILSFAEAGPFALALMTAGCTTMFLAAALRDSVFAAGGYTALTIGVALQLAVWDVTWIEPYLVLPAIAALYLGYRYHRSGGNSWAAYAPTIGLFAYVAIADRIAGGSAWHAVIAGAIGVLAVIGGGYRKLVGPLVTGSAVLAIVVGYESLGPAALVPTWAWLALGGSILLAAGVALERSDTTPLERGQQIRSVLATQYS